MKMNRTVIALWMGLVFACGGLLGALGHRLYTVSAVSANANQRNPEEFRKRFVTTLRMRVKASDEQIAKITAIMDETRSRFRETRSSIEPELKKLREEQQEKIRALLSSEQAAEWDKWREERAQEREERKKRGGGPPR